MLDFHGVVQPFAFARPADPMTGGCVGALFYVYLRGTAIVCSVVFLVKVVLGDPWLAFIKVLGLDLAGNLMRLALVGF